jgi:hypothetical protein
VPVVVLTCRKVFIENVWLGLVATRSCGTSTSSKPKYLLPENVP